MTDSAGHSPRFTLGRETRLRHQRDIKRVFDARCSVSDDRLIVYAAANDLARLRAGVAASTKLGGAVVRNRYKRLLREAFRLSQHDLPGGFDFILVPRARAIGGPASLDEYRQSIHRLTERAVRKFAEKFAPRKPPVAPDRPEGAP